jgi:hypothetical protein
MKKTPDLAEHLHITTAVSTLVGNRFPRADIGDLLFPVSQHVGLYADELGHLADFEI